MYLKQKEFTSPLIKQVEQGRYLSLELEKDVLILVFETKNKESAKTITLRIKKQMTATK